MKASSSIHSSVDVESSTEEWITPDYISGLVSVIIPTYNRNEFVVEAIESLRAQTWKSLEVIVVDDGSTDDTLTALKGIPSLGDSRTLRILEQPNAGVSAARSRGTRAATGEFFVYLDSDDTLLPDAIAHSMAALRASGSDFCYGAIEKQDHRGQRISDGKQWHPKPITPENMITNTWLVHAGCYRRSVIMRVGPWNETLVGYEDMEFLLRIKATSRGVPIPRVLGIYRIHGMNQNHQLYDSSWSFGEEMCMLEAFIFWLKKRGPISPVISRLFVERYRFIAFRQASVGNMEMKNRALSNIALLLEGSWSPRRLYALGRWINFPGFYSGLANLKRRLKG